MSAKLFVRSENRNSGHGDLVSRHVSGGENRAAMNLETRLRPPVERQHKQRTIAGYNRQQRKRKRGQIAASVNDDSDSDDLNDHSGTVDTMTRPAAALATDMTSVETSGATTAKRKFHKKSRRARRKPHKGYYEMNDTERSQLEERERLREAKIRERSIAKGHMLAPYNTTQFIIDGHYEEDASIKRLEEQLLHSSGSTDAAELFKTSPTRLSVEQDVKQVRKRGRDSSFSLDSDEGYFYSSPDDEEEFICKEFSKDYERGNVDRLERMEKSSLIHEYLGLEKKLENLEKKLDEINTRETMKAMSGEVDYDFLRGEVPMEPETAEKIKVFQTEIKKLMRDNKNLAGENAILKRRNKSAASAASRQYLQTSSSSSSDESSSSSSESSSDSSSDEEASDVESSDASEDMQEPTAAQLVEEVDLPAMLKLTGGDGSADGKTDDTGYESTQSKEPTPEPDWRKK